MLGQLSTDLANTPVPIQGLSDWMPLIGAILTVLGTCITGILGWYIKRRSDLDKVESDQRLQEREVETRRYEAELKQRSDEYATRVKQQEADAKRIGDYQTQLAQDVVKFRELFIDRENVNRELAHKLAHALASLEEADKKITRLETDLRHAIDALANKDARIAELERKVATLEREAGR